MINFGSIDYKTIANSRGALMTDVKDKPYQQRKKN